MRIACAVGVTVVAAVSILSAQAPSPPIAKGPNVLVGRVLDIASDAPVGGAIVTLTALTMTTTEAAMQGIRLPARSMMTTSGGDFVFREVPAGKYSIGVSAFGYTDEAYPPKLVELADNPKPASMTLRLWQLASISGRVIDDRGEPVVGVPVTAMRRRAIGGALVLNREYWDNIVTDDRGEYRIPLEPGSYVVGIMSSPTSLPANLAAEIDAVASNRTALFNLQRQLNSSLYIDNATGLRDGDMVLQQPGPASVVAPDGRLLSYATTLFPGTSNVRDATIVTLGSGESRTGVDLPIKFAPTVRVSGVVSGPAGPMANLMLRLVPPQAADADSFEPLGAATAMSDRDGRFTFLGVSPGPYVLKSVFFDRTQERSGLGAPIWATQTLTVGNTDIRNVAVTLKPGTRLTGRVELAGPSAAVTPADRLSIMLRPIAADSWTASIADVRTDRTFTSGGDPPGRYEVYSASAGNWRVTGVSRGGKVYPDYVIELGADDLTEMVVTLSKTPRRITGTVVGSQGAADTEADVIAFPSDASVWREGFFQSRRVQRVRASAAGTFEFTELAPGEYFLAAVSARLTREWQDPQFLERLIPGATKITLGDGDEKTVALKTFAPRSR